MMLLPQLRNTSETLTTLIKIISTNMSQDLKASSSFLDDLLHCLSLRLSEVSLLKTLLKTEQDAGGCKNTGSLVREEVVSESKADGGVGLSPELLNVHSLGEEESWYDMIKIVQSCG